MKRIDVCSPFTFLWFNFSTNDYMDGVVTSNDIREKYFGDVDNRSDITDIAMSITESMWQEKYSFGINLAFNITPRSQFTKIKLL